jgi:hypothetical protein
VSEKIIQQPAFERQKPETNGHTSVANGHTSSAPAPAPARNVLSRHQITVLHEQLRQNEIGVDQAARCSTRWRGAGRGACR